MRTERVFNFMPVIILLFVIVAGLLFTRPPYGKYSVIRIAFGFGLALCSAGLLVLLLI